MTVGERITELRKKKNFTINHLADLAGLSQTHLRDIERGSKKPTIPTLEYITEALEISLHDFFSYTAEDDFLTDPFIAKYCKLTSEQKKAFLYLIETIIPDEKKK